jgi:hypothetical protein
MSDELFEDPIPPSVLELINLFTRDLSQVAFPDVSPDALEALAQKVRSASKELQDALDRAQAARESLESGQSELIAKAVRGLAYAKVFAEGDGELTEKLLKITIGKTGRSPKKTGIEKPKAEKSPADSTADAQKSDEKKTIKMPKKAAE